MDHNMDHEMHHEMENKDHGLYEHCVSSAPVLQLHDDDAGSVTLQQFVNVAAGTFTMILTYTGQAWLGIGASSADGRMVGNVAVVGLPDDGTVKQYYLGGEVDASQSTPLDEQTLLSGSITQNDTYTVLTFTKLLADADQLAVSSDAANTFIYAVGDANNFYYHSIYASFSLQLTPCNGGENLGETSNGLELLASGANNKSKKMFWAHGFFMAAAWGLLVPVAIGGSLLRNYFTSPTAWFVVHRVCNGLGLLFTMIAFALAVSAISNNTGEGESADHFRVTAHRRVGLVVFIMAMLQGLNGIIRPHKPTMTTASTKVDKTKDAAEPTQDSNGSDTGGSEAGNDVGGGAAATAPHKSVARTTWAIGHGLMGAATLLLAWYNCNSGIKRYTELYGGNDTTARAIFWAIALIISVPSLGVGIYSRKNNSAKR